MFFGVFSRLAFYLVFLFCFHALFACVIFGVSLIVFSFICACRHVLFFRFKRYASSICVFSLRFITSVLSQESFMKVFFALYRLSGVLVLVLADPLIFVALISLHARCGFQV